MTIAIWFWIIYVVALLFFGYRNYANRAVILDSLVFWILIALLGFGVFNSPIK